MYTSELSQSSAEGVLLQAALSHLDLALANISEQVNHHEFSVAQRDQLCYIVTKLQTLATQHQKECMNTVVSLDTMLPLDNPEARVLSRLDAQASVGEELIVSEHSHDEVLRVANPEFTDMLKGLQAKSINGAMLEQMEASQDNTCDDPPPKGEASKTWSSSDSRLEVVDMLAIMLEAFREICHGESFAVQWDKLMKLSVNLGLRGSQVQTVFFAAGKTHDGLVFEEEWISLAKAMLALHERKEIIDMIKHARRRKMHGQRLSSFHSQSRVILTVPFSHHLKLSCKSRRRVMWDIFMLTLLIYVAFTLPLTLAFRDLLVLERIDLVVDWIFFFDVFVNFRTTFINDVREEVWESKAIAKNYLKSWFTLDFISSCPLEQLSNGFLPRLQSAKLLKFGKLAKATKVFRLGKVMRMWAGSEVMELAEEFLWSKNLSVVSQGCMVLMQLVICGHWSACLLLATDGRAVDAYLGHAADGLQTYLASLYWAITTMTTVGYGDVTMQSEWERVYAIFAMMAGGTFYGYIVGVVTTILSHRDLDQRAFRERMDAVGNWLNHHYELPSGLRRRVWRHFKEFLTARTAVEDSMILNDLPPEMCHEVSEALLQDSVRHNPYFENLSIRAVSALTAVLIETKMLANETIVCEGDPGIGMFIIDRGFVELETQPGDTIQHLGGGGSFGVEILLRDVSQYAYTAKTRSKVRFYKLLSKDFVVIFKDMQKDLMTILDNFYHTDGASQECSQHQAEPGKASLIKGGPRGVPPDFANVVLEHFNHLIDKFDKKV